MNKNIRKHRKNIRRRSNNLKSTNPKECWKIRNSGRRKNNSDIQINVWLDYFKTLNADAPNDQIDENQPYTDTLNEPIKAPITKTEIELA